MVTTRVGIVYGGRSGEHEVSIASAASIFKHLDRDRFVGVPIRIEKDGRWVLPEVAPTTVAAGDVFRAGAGEPLPPVDPTAALLGSVSRPGVDIAFPVLHGPYGEDGTIQGLFELANVPYVGAGVLGSAVGMDKAVMKTLFVAAGLPVGPYMVITAHDWTREARAITARVTRELGFPVFVKPANLGSSVGITKAASEEAFGESMRVALDYDRKVVVEAAVPHPREIECAVLGNDEPESSLPGEVICSREFYDYEAKYLDAASRAVVPAQLAPETVVRIRELAIGAFRAVDGAGLARVDFLIDGRTGAIVVNEVNTMPGFTTISMYPQMWDASGLPYPRLLDRLIALGFERHREKQRLRTSVV